MSTDVAARRSGGRWLVRLELLALLALASFLGWTAIGVVREGRMQEIHPADAIVVFGAAEYAGHPSPVLRLRLDHGFELFQKGIAPVVITTGGAASDPSFSEGGVGRDYLERRGIPERNLIAETQGSDTAQSAARVADHARQRPAQLRRGQRRLPRLPHQATAAARRLGPRIRCAAP